MQDVRYPSLSQILSTERWLVTFLISLCLARMGAIILTPLEFGVDEAQYWLWGQSLDFGYYSKPPLIGWYLGFIDFLFGSSTIAARITAPIIHLLIALILYAIASAHHSARAGRWAALLWASLPIVSLGSFVISTDTLLLLPWVIALALFLRALRQDNALLFFLSGLVIGIGILAKYAAVYFLLGAVISLLITHAKRPKFALTSFATMIAGALFTSAPNLIWNALNRGVTFAHLGENADLNQPLYSIENALQFLLSQSAVIGPVSFVILCAIILRLRRLEIAHSAKILLAFSLPVIAIMTVQAFLKTANANWTATAWPAMCLLFGYGLAQTSPQKIISSFWGKLALSVNLFAALIIIVGVAVGHLGSLTPASDPLRRLRGWEALANDVTAIAKEHNAAIIVADRRAEAALLSWHLHDTDFVVKVLDEDNRAGSHFELNHALSNNDVGPFIVMTGRDGTLPETFKDAIGPVGESITQISDKRNRHKLFFKIESLF